MKRYFFYCLVVFLGIFIGAFSVYNTRILIIPIGILFSFFIFRYGLVRFIYVVFGSMFIFQSSDGFGSAKIGFLAGLVLVGLIAILKAKEHFKNSMQLKLISPLIITFVLFSVYIFINIGYSVSVRNASLISAIRDASPYLLFAVSPFLALDTAVSVNEKWITRMFIISGSLATFTFAYSWISKRGLVETNMEQIGLASFMLPAAFFSYCCSRFLIDKKNKKVLWAGIAALVLAGMLLSGTRSAFAFLIAPLAISLFGNKYKILGMLKFGISIVIIGVFSLLGMILISQLTDGDTVKLKQRLSGINVLVDSNQLNNDASYLDRKYQTEISLMAFKEYSILGIGSGIGYNEYSSRDSFTLDSPFSYIAKFGLVGALFLVMTFYGTIKMLLRIKKNKKEDQHFSYYALLGFLSITSFWMLLGPPFEDKGFYLGLLLLLSMIFKYYVIGKKSKNIIL